MSYFRSLLEAAMGNEEMPANMEAFDGVGDEDDEDDSIGYRGVGSDVGEDDDDDFSDEGLLDQQKRMHKKPRRPLPPALERISNGGSDVLPQVNVSGNYYCECIL
jgi:hypothetical protein